METYDNSLPFSRLTLERVLGLTSMSNSMLAMNSATEEIAYTAGCIVVIYNIRKNKQVRYYRLERRVSCLNFSSDGSYLAIGETGDLPSITIWNSQNGTLQFELRHHKGGVSCLAFSTSNRTLFSVGIGHHANIVAWDLSRSEDNGKVIGMAQTKNKTIVSVDFSNYGQYFVTAGPQHVAYWYLEKNENGLHTTGTKLNDNVPELAIRETVRTTQEEAIFTCVACENGPSSTGKTFACTLGGTLCCFNLDGVLERLVSLETPTGHAVSVIDSYVAVAGASSIVRLFDPLTLEYQTTLPFTPALGKAQDFSAVSQSIPITLLPEQPYRHAAAIAVQLLASYVVIIYSDHTLFIYKVEDEIKLYRSFLFHSGSIRDLQVAGKPIGVNKSGKIVYKEERERNFSIDPSRQIPIGTFATCSDDNTLRFWHLEYHKNKSKRHRGGETLDNYWKNPYSQELLRIVYNDDERVFAKEDAGVLGRTCSSTYEQEFLDSVANGNGSKRPGTGLQAIAIRSNHIDVAVGDTEGNVCLLQLDRDIHCPVVIGSQPHSMAITSLAFGESTLEIPDNLGKSGSQQLCLLASGGQDPITRIYTLPAVQNRLDPPKDLVAIENQSNGIHKLQFTNDGRHLLSCGVDKCSLMRSIDQFDKQYPLFSQGSVQTLTVASDNKNVFAVRNGYLEVYNVDAEMDAEPEKQMEDNTPLICRLVKKHLIQDQKVIAISPANLCVAVTGSISNSTINVIDAASGKVLADGTGHGEPVTCVQFTPDCRRLISASADGCIFVWRLPEDVQKKFKQALPNLIDEEFRGAIPRAPVTFESKSSEQTVTLPPPAPPIQFTKMKPATEIIESHSITKSSEVCLNPVKQCYKDTDEAAQSIGWLRKPSVVLPAGPMQNNTIEEWMKTRISSDAIVGNSSDDDEIEDDKAILSIDHSITPSWAKTKAYTVDETLSNVEKKVSSKLNDSVTVGKWAERATGLEPYAVASSTPIDKTPPSNGIILQNTVTTSISSLALERDHLSKKKKQQETAKAVELMTSKLAKLGLLKFEKHKESSPPKDSAVKSNANSRKTSDALLDDIPSELLESITYDKSSLVTNEICPEKPIIKSQPQANDEEKSNIEKKPERTVISSPDSVSNHNENSDLAGSYSKFTRGYTLCISEFLQKNDDKIAQLLHDSVHSSPARRNISTASAQVNQSLSSFTTGYSTPANEKLNARSTQVNRSLSSFTNGYCAPTSNSTAMVNQSLSSFTMGFTAPAPENKNATVSQSLSSFTTGYNTPADEKINTRSTQVNQSLSSFITGYSAAGVGIKNTTSAQVNQSFSSFTTGYSAPVEKSHGTETTPVNQSLSTLTSGSWTQADKNSESNRIDKNGDPNSDQVTQSLSSFTSGYNPHSDNIQTDVESEVNQSYSTFTTGYNMLPNSTVTTVSRDKSITESFSSYTSGYTHTLDTDIRALNTQNLQSTTFTDAPIGDVLASISIFTNGYTKNITNTESFNSPIQSNAPQVNASLSSITSGNTQDPKPIHGIAIDKSRNPNVLESMSTFTTGYTFQDNITSLDTSNIAMDFTQEANTNTLQSNASLDINSCNTVTIPTSTTVSNEQSISQDIEQLQNTLQTLERLLPLHTQDTDMNHIRVLTHQLQAALYKKMQNQK